MVESERHLCHLDFHALAVLEKCITKRTSSVGVLDRRKEEGGRTVLHRGLVTRFPINHHPDSSVFFGIK
jgi:hypothetical protein